MELIEIQKALVEVLRETDQVFRDEAEAKVEFVRLERKKKSYFAMMKSKFEGADNARERQAFCDKEWTEFEVELIEAECGYIMALSNKDALEAKREVLRSLNKSPNISY